jgi:hypothetical protein
MAARRSKDKSPVRLPPAPTGNVYEDTESNRSEQEVLAGWDGRGAGPEYSGGWRREKKRRTDYESDLNPYGSPRSKRPQGRRNLHAKLNDDMSTGRRRRERPVDAPGTSKVRRQRSRTPELYYRTSSTHTGQRRTSDNRQSGQ